MNCVFGPYKISCPSFPNISGTEFFDPNKTRQVLVIGDCSSPILEPCSNSTVIHESASCEDSDCKMRWYECPSMGRTYTLIATPCGVKITSFENGLLKINQCSSDIFGSGFYCFGKVYTETGEFEGNSNSSLFEFDGHSFTVEGVEGNCGEFFNCVSCKDDNIYSDIELMESIPDSIPESETATLPNDSEIDTTTSGVITKIIPSENRTIWHNTPPNDEGQDTICNDELNVTSWAGYPVFSEEDLACISNNNPSVVSLPSGHSLISYEQRNSDGLTSIGLAILPSSVNKNIRYYRKLSRGTLLNNTNENQASFEIYEELGLDIGENGVPIGQDTNLAIGFLNGPIAGPKTSNSPFLYPITKITRTLDNNDVVKYLLNFSIASQIEFPDGNNQNDIMWFLVNDVGSGELPPNSANIITSLELEPHVFQNISVPLANPSIAVAHNNLMTGGEQNVYLVYQAFEANQWRVYLRQIVLGADGNLDPTYLTPYLFDSDQVPGQRPVKTFKNEIVTTFDTATVVAWEENFTGASGGPTPLEDLGNWEHAIPPFEELFFGMFPYDQFQSEILLCSSTEEELDAGISCLPFNTCKGYTGNFGENFENFETVPGEGCLNPPIPNTLFPSSVPDGIIRTIYMHKTPALEQDGSGATNISLKMTLHKEMVFNGGAFYVFYIGRNTPDVSPEHPMTEGWKVSFSWLERAPNTFTCRVENVLSVSEWQSFVSLRNGQTLIGPNWDDTIPENGGVIDVMQPIFEAATCIDMDWNGTSPNPNLQRINVPATPWFPPYLDEKRKWEFELNTFNRGKHRVFALYHNIEGSLLDDNNEPIPNTKNPKHLMWMATAEDVSTFNPTTGKSDLPPTLGPYHGIGFYGKRIDVLKQVKLEINPINTSHIFYEDFFNYDFSLQLYDSSPFFCDLGEKTRFLSNVVNEPNVLPGKTFVTPCIRNIITAVSGSANVPAIYSSDNSSPNERQPDQPWRQVLRFASDIDPTNSVPGWWGVFRLKTPAQIWENNIPIDVFDTSLIAGIPKRAGANNTVDYDAHYLNVWFLLRQPDINSSPWHSGWRIRIQKYINQLDTSIHKWKLSLYDGDLSTGDDSDTPIQTITKIIGSDTNLTWDDLSLSESNGAMLRWDRHKEFIARSQMQYFRVDTQEISGTTQFTVLVGTTHKTVPVDHCPELTDQECPGFRMETPDEVQYEILHQFTPVSSKHFGTYYGIAAFSESTAIGEFPIGDKVLDIDSVSLQAFGGTSPPPPTGSCCFQNGAPCQDLTQAQCIGDNSNNIWNASTTCINVDCSASFPTGASCRDSDGFCTVSTEAFVPGGYSNWQAGKNCIEGDSNYRNCTTVLGKCCTPFNGCLDSGNAVTHGFCKARWGNDFLEQYWSSNNTGVTCPNMGCPSIDLSKGSCCLPAFSGCQIITSSECSDLGGTFKGAGTECTSCTGACCHTSETACVETHIHDCLVTYTTPFYSGNETTCAEVNCTDQRGSCCFDDGQCGYISEGTCHEFIYTSWTSAQDCNPNPCEVPTGACCDPLTGICSILSESQCDNLGGVFSSGVCTDGLCEQPTGACCINNICSQLNHDNCVNSGGTFFGNNTQCLPDHCEMQDPYSSRTINYKPDDLWVIQSSPGRFVTRVLYNMQEESVFSSIKLDNLGNTSNAVDFMFIIDSSGSMENNIMSLSDSIPAFNNSLIENGIDARFGLVLFARSDSALPDPVNQAAASCCDSKIINALYGSSTCVAGGNGPPDGFLKINGGFTRSVSVLQTAFNCWGEMQDGGSTAAWASIKFAIENEEISWRENSHKFIFLVTNSEPLECLNANCSNLSNGELISNIKNDAISSLLSNGVKFIPVICTTENNEQGECEQGGGELFLDIPEITGWNGPIFTINSNNYNSIFLQVSNQLNSIIRQSTATVIERSESGTGPTFVKPAELLITYDGDLSDLWTFNKTEFEFTESHAPMLFQLNKGLNNVPFTLTSDIIYGVNPVHVLGDPGKWVSLGKKGNIRYDYPNVGKIQTSVSSPILISKNSTRPKVFVNHRNQVIIAYENYNSGLAQIQIKGSGDFYQNSITGPKANRITRFLIPNDFSFNYAITLSGDGVNQLCDFVIDNSDVVHIVWQSNIDNEWEIYYANSYNMFDPVRITKSDSRSSSPKIDVNSSGDIFVVYHDNRFGPFEIMLSNKHENRVMPLLEQDAYLASLRSQYGHYVNTLPIIIENPAPIKKNLTGEFWGTKTSKGAGNDNENYVYELSLKTGLPSNGTQPPTNIDYIAWSRNQELYGITIIDQSIPNTHQGSSLKAILYKLATSSETGRVIFDIQELGEIDLSIQTESGTKQGYLSDMNFDTTGRLWILIDSPNINSFEGVFKSISTTNGNTILSSPSIVGGVNPVSLNVFGGDQSAFTIDESNVFYVMSRKYDDVNNSWSNTQFIKSGYPSIIDNTAQFTFVNIKTINSSEDFSIRSMTTDGNDLIYIATNDNDLYLIDKQSGETTFKVSLTTDSSISNNAFPIGYTSGISFHYVQKDEIVDKSDFFHVIVEFFDNINLEGDPFLTIDSRNNLEAFIREPISDDPYSDPYLLTVSNMDARGIFIPQGFTGIVFFDASQFSPGFPNLSQPYSFETNQTYFPKVFSVSSNGNIQESTIQNSSFSCTKCSRLGSNNFNSSGCSYSFVVTNRELVERFYNFEIDFYADVNKKHLLKEFKLLNSNEDLSFVEVDNVIATNAWSEDGLKILPGDSVFIQVYPALDPNAGFLCGVKYTVEVKQCINDPDDETCVNFTKITPSNWDPILVNSPNKISTDLSPTLFGNTIHATGLSMINNGGVISIAYRTSDDKLAYVTFDGSEWTSELIFTNSFGQRVIYCDLGVTNGNTSIIYLINEGTDLVGKILQDGAWVDTEFFNRYSGTFISLVPTILNDKLSFIQAINSTGSRNRLNYHFGQNSNFPNDNNSYRETFNSNQTCMGAFNDAIIANGIPYVVYYSGNILYLSKRKSGTGLPIQSNSWETIQVSDGLAFSVISGACETTTDPNLFNTIMEEPGKPAIVSLPNGNIGIAYIQQSGAVSSSSVISNPDNRELIYKEYDGISFIERDTKAGQGRWGKNIAMEIINGNPHIAYTKEKENGVVDIYVSIFDGTGFYNDGVANDIKTSSPVIDIVEFDNRAAIIISANPLTVYLQRSKGLSDIEKIGSVFLCDCGSTVFNSGQKALSEIGRWESSAHGFSDTRVTDTFKDSINPSIKTRISGSAIIVWEDYNKSSLCTDPPCIRAATFRDINQDQLRSSGSQSWFDYDLGTRGIKPNLDIDIYGRSVSGFEKIIPANSQGFYGHGVSQNELPTSEIINKVCDFKEHEVGQPESSPPSTDCDLDSIESNTVVFDKFISNKIIKKFRVRDDFVQYYTYNASGLLTSIVSDCNIVLEIHGVPGVIAVRLKNENEIDFGAWCPWSPEIGDFIMEKSHRISPLSGVKSICLQAMTYSGITSQFCIPIVADYATVVFETIFYKSSISGNDFISLSSGTADSDGVENFNTNDLDLKLLPLSEGVSVANLSPETETESPLEIEVLFEIIPNKKPSINISSINFDVLQQGSGDATGLVAVLGKNNNGKSVYRGFFTVKKEDNLLNIDGLARISPHFPNECQSEGEISVTNASYDPDTFNILEKPEEVMILQESDKLSQFRQEVSGKIGVDINIRSVEDPYFIFGDPNYSLNKLDPTRDGVPRGKSSESTTNTPDSGGGQPGGGGPGSGG